MGWRWSGNFGELDGLHTLDKVGQRFRKFAIQAQQIGREHRRAADQRPRDDALFLARRDMCGAGQAQGEARGNQRHHQVAGCHPFGDQWFHVHTAQHTINLPAMTFARLRIAQHQRIAQ